MDMQKPRVEFKLGAQVQATDGDFGNLYQVILSELDRRVVALIVRRAMPPPCDVVVPIAEVADASEQRVWLRVSRADLDERSALDHAGYVELPDGNQGYGAGEALLTLYGGAEATDARALVARHLGANAQIAYQGYLADQAIALQRGQAVWCDDRRAGRVHLLLLDENGQVRHFVIRKGLLLGHNLIAPIEWVRQIDQRGVWLAVEYAALDRLPAYSPNDQIAADVDRALWKDDVICAVDYYTIDIAVRGGVVHLGGYAATPVSKARAEVAAYDIPGVIQVDNQIVTDGELVSAVTQLYGRDPLIHAQRLFVQAQHGKLYLSGHATSPDICAAVKQMAANVPRVRAVINEVLAPGVMGVEVLRAIQLSIGQAVHASEMPLGQVERVVVSPQQSRVTAFVAHGHVPDLERATPRMLPKEMPKQERRVVIPISAVREITAEGIQLRVSGLEIARYSEFDSANFVASDIDWPALPAYRPADVLIDRGGAETQRQDLRPATSGEALMVKRALGGALVWEYIEQGMPVACRDGIAGTVDHVRVDPVHGGVSQIVVGGGRQLLRDTLVPLDWIARIDEQGVFVNVGVAQLAALPAAASRTKSAEMI